ncbi:MAG: cyclic nucleotide-gated ion channel [Bdellovibrionota bacterium]
MSFFKKISLIENKLVYLKNFGFFLVAIHILSLGWFLIEGFSNSPDLLTSYNKSIYWTITTLTTIGYGDITPQSNWGRVYTMLVMLMGVAVYGAVIAKVSSFLIQKDKRSEVAKEKLESLKSFMKHYEIPLSVQSEIKDYYTHLLGKQANEFEQQILNELPSGLKKQVLLHIKKMPLKRIELFKNCSEECLNEVCAKLEQVFFEPNRHIIRAGQMGAEMFLLDHGCVEIFINEQSIVKLEKGQCFGEMALLGEQTRTADVISSSYCDLYVLSKSDFDEICEKHKDLYDNAQALMQSRLKAA